MKKIAFLLVLFFAGIHLANAQKKWEDLSKEEKMSKLESFRKDNQNYLKNTLGMSDTQLEDIDNVNLCFLSSLDRVDRYVKTDADKEKYAKALVKARGAQLDGIMGVEKRKKFMEYVNEKVKKAKM